jgi:tetratricopeptide (TPR) repeat protein
MKNLNHISIFALFGLLPVICLSQNDKIDSLKKVLPALIDSARVDCLNALSYEYILLGKKEPAEGYADLAYENSRKHNYIHGIAVSFSRKSHIARKFYDDFVKSEQMGKSSLSWFVKTSNKAGYDYMYNNLLNALFAQSKFEEAMQYVEETYAVAKESGDTLKILNALHRIFTISRLSGNYEKSFLFTQRAYKLALKANNKIWIANSLCNMAQLYMLIEDYPAALSYFRTVIQRDDDKTRNERIKTQNDIWFKMEFAETFSHLNQFDSAWYYYNLFKPSKEDSIYIRIYRVSIGECYYLQKNYRSALENFLAGLAEHKKLNDRNEIMRTLLNIGKTYLALNNNSEALKYGREGLDIAVQTKAKRFIREGYQILSTIYDRLNQTDSTNFYFRQYITMKDSVLNDQTKGKFTAYNYEQKIALINQEKEIQQAKLEKESLVKKVLIASFTGLAILGIFILRNIILKRRNEKQRLEHELEIQKLESEKTKIAFQQQATELEMQALRAQMNPHFIFNSLSSINMFILENNKLQASEYLSKFSRLVRLILQNSQEAYIALDRELEALGLYLELESLRFEQRFEYKISVHDEVDTTMVKVPPLIIQPYAENAIWHGLMHKKEKGHLEIELYVKEKILFCKITDDGIGRERAAELKSKSSLTYKSMGMRITADRIAILQQQEQNNSFISVNDLVFPDGRPAGTEVLIKLPVDYD